MSILSRIWGHLSRFREVYGHLPLALLFIFLFSMIVRVLTGRPALDNISDLTGVGENFLKLILGVVIAGFVKGHLLTDLTDSETKTLPLGRVILDSVETLILLCASWFFLFWH